MNSSCPKPKRGKLGPIDPSFPPVVGWLAMIKTPEGSAGPLVWGLGWDKWQGSTHRTATAQEPSEAKRVIHGPAAADALIRLLHSTKYFPLQVPSEPRPGATTTSTGPLIDDTSWEAKAEQHVATRPAPALALRHAQLMTTIHTQHRPWLRIESQHQQQTPTTDPDNAVSPAAPAAMGLSAKDSLQLRAALQIAAVKCSERCLYQSAKW